MTKEELERIKQAYNSGLKIQIWFDGNWEDFDIREYSMYPEPFSEHRRYRIVGSAYADFAEQRIAELEKENEKLKKEVEKHKWNNIFLEDCADYDKKIAEEYTTLQERIAELEVQIEKMKCCGNCAKQGSVCVAEEYKGILCGKQKDKWELKGAENGTENN